MFTAQTFTTAQMFTAAQMFTPGGGGRVLLAFVYIYITNSPQKKMELTAPFGGLPANLWLA